MAAKRKPSFNSHNPVTGEDIGTYAIMSKEQVNDAVDHARTATTAWQALGFTGRKKVLLAWSALIIDRVEHSRADLLRDWKASQ